MNIFNVFKRNNNNNDNTAVTTTDNDDYTQLSKHFNTINEHTALNLSTVYRCVEILSNSVAQLPLYPYFVTGNAKRLMSEHAVYKLFTLQPNRRQTRYMFLKLLVQNMLLKGNAYALIERDETNKPIALHYIPSDYVSVIQPLTIFEDVKYLIAGLSYVVEHKDIIHIINYPDFEGIRGVSTIYYATKSLSLATNSEDAANEHLSQNVAGLLSVESALSTQQAKDAKRAWMKSVKQEGSVAVLSGGWKFQTVSMNAKDAQLIESRQFNSVDIARWFGVPTTKLGISTGVAYAGIEAEQIAFLTDTLQTLLQKIESEFESKLLTDNERLTTDIRFDISSFLRTDMKSKAEIYRTLFNIGAMTINEIRNDLDLQNVEGGDTTYLQVNMTTLNNLNQQTTNNDNKQ